MRIQPYIAIHYTALCSIPLVVEPPPQRVLQTAGGSGHPSLDGDVTRWGVSGAHAPEYPLALHSLTRTPTAAPTHHHTWSIIYYLSHGAAWVSIGPRAEGEAIGTRAGRPVARGRIAGDSVPADRAAQKFGMRVRREMNY